MLQLFKRVKPSALLLCCAILSLCIGIYLQFFNTPPLVSNPPVIARATQKPAVKQLDQKDKKEGDISQNDTKITTSSAQIYVDVAGGVEEPGVYALPIDSRITDALIVAGGISKKGDKAWVGRNINLATKLADGDKIFIPLIGEVKVQTPVQELANPASYNTTPIPQIAGISTNQPGLQKAPITTSPAPSQTTATPTDGKVNINTATASELDILPGVGAVTAQKIISNRPYQTLEELKEKKAVNKSTFEKIKEKIKL